MTSVDGEFAATVLSIALAGDGLVLGVGMAALAFTTWLKYSSHAKALKQVRSTPLSDISDLRCLLQSTSEDVHSMKDSNIVEFSARNSLESSRKQDPKDLFVIVRGNVQPKRYVDPNGKGGGEVFVAPNTGQKAVMVEKTQTCLYNERRGISGWSLDWRSLLGQSSSREKVIVSRRMVPFVLVESAGETPAFTIVDLADSQHPLPLSTVYQQFNPAQPSYGFLQGMFARRFVVGVLDEEKILPIGKELTAVGILTASPDGFPVIKPCSNIPCFLTNDTRDQMIDDIVSEAETLYWVAILLSGVAAGVLAYAITKIWVKWKHKRREEKRKKEEEKMAKLLLHKMAKLLLHVGTAGEEDVPDGELCVICLLRRRRVAFTTCGHRVCCIGCAQKVKSELNPRCPVCRHNIVDIICIYDA